MSGVASAAYFGSLYKACAKAGQPTVIAQGGGTLGRSLARQIKQAAGGGRVRLLISPYSTEDPKETAAFEGGLLRRLGFSDIEVLDLGSSRRARDQIAAADAIWFTGGHQKTQVLTLGKVPGLHSALREAHANGVVMAGSSAGAAVLSRLMISGGQDGAVYTRAGLGFWNNVVLDQHVGERHREYRLRKVIGANRKLIGIGLDEDVWVNYSNGSAHFGGRGFARLVYWSDGLKEKTLRDGSKVQLPD